MKMNLEARDVTGGSVDMELSASRISGRIELRDLQTERRITFNAEELLRAVRSAWEILRPIERA